MPIGAKVLGRLFRRGFVEDAHAILDAQYAPHGVVQARLRDGAIIHFAHQVGIEVLPALGFVEDVQPGIEGGGTVGVAAPRNLAMGQPVAHDEAVKAHMALQDTRHQSFIGVHLDAVPTVVGGHDRLGAGIDRRLVTGAMDRRQLQFADQGIALVAAAVGRAVAEKMLGGRDDVILVKEGRALPFQAGNHGGGIGRDDLRIFRIAFIAAAPAVVTGDRNGRCKRPVHAGGTHLGGGGFTDLADQVGIVGGAQADIVRKERGAIDIVVAVDGVRRPDQGDGDVLAGRHRGVVIGLDQIHPVLDGRMFVAGGDRAAAILDRADMILGHLFRLDRLPFRLDDLADLFLDCHLLQQGVDLRLNLGVQAHRRLAHRPQFRMNVLRVEGPGWRCCISDRGRDKHQGSDRHRARHHEMGFDHGSVP